MLETWLLTVFDVTSRRRASCATPEVLIVVGRGGGIPGRPGIPEPVGHRNGPQVQGEPDKYAGPAAPTVNDEPPGFSSSSDGRAGRSRRALVSLSAFHGPIHGRGRQPSAWAVTKRSRTGTAVGRTPSERERLDWK